MRDDVVIVGDGPAGRAVAAACAEAGLATVCVGPDPGRPWRNTYGAWVDELASLPPDVIAQRYERPIVRTERIDVLPLGRGYALLDNAALQQRLRDRAAAGGAREASGVARGVSHDGHGSTVYLADGRALPAGVVVDASGHRPALAQAGRGPAAAWQVAHGVIGRFDPPPVAPGGACFMDWRRPPATDGEPPTFCYVLDLGDGVTLVEETSLAARPARRRDDLCVRLERRLAADGITVTEHLGEERVRFPMGGPLPPRDQRVVAFGAAAGMVHPATGFQVAAALRTAPALAAALAGALAAAGRTPERVAAAGWRAVWPLERLRQRALHAFGLELLVGLDAPGIQRFFEAFFSLPTAQWSAYVSGARRAREVAAIMASVAVRLPAPLRLRLVRHALGPHGARLAHDLVAAGGGWRGTSVAAGATADRQG